MKVPLLLIWLVRDAGSEFLLSSNAHQFWHSVSLGDPLRTESAWFMEHNTHVNLTTHQRITSNQCKAANIVMY